MKNLPEIIYLNIGDNCPDDTDFRNLSEVTWSEDKVNDTDLPYVRKSEWIPIEKRLPKEGECVLIARYDTVYKAKFVIDGRPFFIMEWDKLGDLDIIYPSDGITHWMYIPQLPKK